MASDRYIDAMDDGFDVWGNEVKEDRDTTEGTVLKKPRKITTEETMREIIARGYPELPSFAPLSNPGTPHVPGELARPCNAFCRYKTVPNRSEAFEQVGPYDRINFCHPCWREKERIRQEAHPEIHARNRKDMEDALRAMASRGEI